MTQPDTDPPFPEHQPDPPSAPETETPGGAEVPDATPFNGDPYDGRTHDGGGEPAQALTD